MAEVKKQECTCGQDLIRYGKTSVNIPNEVFKSITNVVVGETTRIHIKCPQCETKNEITV